MTLQTQLEVPMTLQTQLEDLIDRHGLTAVLEAVEATCFLKAEHVLVDWQDWPVSQMWDKVGTKVGLAIVASRAVPQ